MNSPVIVPVVPVTKGRGKKVNKEVVVNEKSESHDIPQGEGEGEGEGAGDKPRKNLIAKHALLHAFTLHLAQTSLDNGLFDKDLFDRFLASQSFFLDIPSLSNLFDNLPLKNLLKNAKIARKNWGKNVATKEKKPRAKKEKTVDGETTDLISSLVSLASNKEPVAPESPKNTLKAEEPEAPVKQKRKYNRKPKVAATEGQDDV
jgi:hypothetical protein